MNREHWARTGLLITNPRAGAGRTDLIDADEVARLCAQWIPGLTTVATEYRGHAEELAGKAAAEGDDVVVAAGGDGTVREVTSGLVRAAAERPGVAGPAVVNIPAGTANSFYREVWSDRPWQQALDAALSGAQPHIRRVDVAHVVEEDALSLLGTGTGLVAEVLALANGLGIPGRERYRQAVAQVVREAEAYPGRIEVDGETLYEGTIHLTNIGGGRYRAGQFRLMPHSVLDDGLLDICVVSGDLAPAEILDLTRDGNHVNRPEVAYARGRHFVLERTDGQPLTLEYDGEMAAGEASRRTVRILAGVLPVLAPPAGT